MGPVVIFIRLTLAMVVADWLDQRLTTISSERPSEMHYLDAQSFNKLAQHASDYDQNHNILFTRFTCGSTAFGDLIREVFGQEFQRL